MKRYTNILDFKGVKLTRKHIDEALEKLREYEELNMTPNEIRAKLLKLETYDRMEEDGRFMLMLDKNGYCDELGMYIHEIRNKLTGGK